MLCILDWTVPPLTENQRWSHWAAKNRVVQDVRLTGRLTMARLGRQKHVTVTLTWVVRDHRRRDADNLVPTLKALCDGLVDASIVPDDTPEFMTKIMPVIRCEPGAVPHFEFEVVPNSD